MSTVLFSVKSFEFQKRHLLIVGILCVAFVISFLIRAEPLQFGYELNEFDPFFNYRATQYLVENGFSAYFSWHDDLSWYPHGRDVSSNSQVMLHITTAMLYWIFGANGSLYSFTILFPIVIGSLTAIVLFALVRTFAGTTAGLFSALLFAVSPSIIVRGSAGWFKSEPLGLFYGILGLFLFFNALQSKNHKLTIIKLVGAGLLVTFSLASWGGTQFLLLPLGLYIMTIPFLRNDSKFTLWAIPLFVASALSSSILFERPGLQFVTGLGGFSLIVPTLFVIGCFFIKLKNETHAKRNAGIFLIAIIILAGVVLLIGENSVIRIPSHRYLNAVNPFLTTTDPLVDSVSEHATNTINQSFFFESFLMVLAGIGAWFLFRNFQKNNFHINNDFGAFMLIFGLLGVYISSAFIRLELFSSLAVIILGSVSLSILSSLYFSSKNKKLNSALKYSFISVMIFFVMTPLVFPSAPNWTNASSVPPTILNGGSKFIVSTTDWQDSMNWIKDNTPKDSTIVSWWDYGYWIETLSGRVTYSDNATVDTNIIKKVAEIFFSSPDDAWKSLREMKADYVLVFVSGQQLQTNNPVPLYVLDGGGEESKKQWILKISGKPESKYLYSDYMSGTDEFWNNTLLGKLIPYSPVIYTNGVSQSETYQPGMVAVYTKNIKYPSDSDGPFRLAYASKSITSSNSGAVIGVLVYEVNSDYVPNQP